MFDGLSKKQFGIIFLIVFTVYAVWFGLNADQISADIMQGGIFYGLGLYLLSQPAYLLLIFFLFITRHRYNGEGWKVLLGALVLILAFDIVGLPHTVPATGFSDEVVTWANPDTIIIRELVKVVPFGLAWNFYYLILPALLVVVSLWLLGFVKFKDKLLGMGKL